MRGTTRLIKTWATGELGADVTEGEPVGPYEGALVLVLERAAHFDRLVDDGLVGSESRVFVRGVADRTDERSGATVLGYDGSLSDPGGDVQIGAQFFLQTQDYGTSEYLSLIGTTLIRLVDEADFETFLADADRAREKGEFAEFATHPLVRICDVTALGSARPDQGPRLRLYVDAAGEISTSPSGARLGEVGCGLDQLESEWAKQNGSAEVPDAVALARSVPEDARVRGLTQRPWIPQYHAVLAGLRDVRTRGLSDPTALRASGFGGRLDSALDGVAEPADVGRSGTPVLLWAGADGYVVDPATEKTFRLGLPAARLAERLLVSGSVDAAAGGKADEQSLIRVDEFFQKAGVHLCAS